MIKCGGKVLDGLPAMCLMLLLLVAIPSAIPTIGHDAMLKLF